MSKTTCSLCELPLPDPPVTGEDVEGAFCCQGCLQVHRLLKDLDEGEAREIKEEALVINEQTREVKGEAREVKEKAREAREGAPDQEDSSAESLFLRVDGMHCATCESFLGALALRQPGVITCEASYASEMARVRYDPRRTDPAEITEALSRMGYRARPATNKFISTPRAAPDGQAGPSAWQETEPATEPDDQAVRLAIGGFFGIMGLLLYALFLYPTYLGGEGIVPLRPAENLFIVANIFVMTTFVLGYTGFPILRGAWVSLSVGQPNMDLLVSVAACSAWLYSTGVLLAGGGEVYFDVTMAIILVVTLGNRYEHRIRRSKNSILDELTRRGVDRARVRRNGSLEEIPPSTLQPHDRVIVLAGERIPVDGTVTEGEGVVDEALITGESLPVTKREGDRVSSGTVLTQNRLEIDTGASVSSTLDALVRMMWNIQSSRPGQQRLADRIASWFVPGVLLLGAVTFLAGWLGGAPASTSLLTALAVLIVSCPCALGLATPLALASGMREALRRNIIFKTGALFEEEGEADIVAFDKTGTLTGGRMELLEAGENPRALELAAVVEQYSSHPVGKAIAAAGKSGVAADPPITELRTASTGISGTVHDLRVHVGQPEWIRDVGFVMTPSQQATVNKAREAGQVPVAVAWEVPAVPQDIQPNPQDIQPDRQANEAKAVHAILVVGDRLRKEAPDVVARLKAAGKKVAVITGDSERASSRLAQTLNPDFLFSGARPESKTNILRNLKKFGTVAMVGDGSNDAPALAEADYGIAFGDLTAVAAESAQIVIPEPHLHRVFSAFRAIRLTRRRIRQNLGWAFLYNAVCIPLAVAGLINPLFAALAMAASSLLVVGNSARGMALD